MSQWSQVDEHAEHVSENVLEIHPKLQATREQAEPVPGHMRASRSWVAWVAHGSPKWDCSHWFAAWFVNKPMGLTFWPVAI